MRMRCFTSISMKCSAMGILCPLKHTYLYYQGEEKCSISSDFHTGSAITESSQPGSVLDMTCTFLYILAQIQEPTFVFCFHYKVTQNLGNLRVPSHPCVISWTIVPHSVLFHLYKCPLLPLNGTTYTSSILWSFLYHAWCHPLWIKTEKLTLLLNKKEDTSVLLQLSTMLLFI